MTSEKADEADFLWSEFCQQSEYCKCEYSWVVLQFFSNEIKPSALKMEVWSMKYLTKPLWFNTQINQKYLCYKDTLLYMKEFLSLNEYELL